MVYYKEKNILMQVINEDCKDYTLYIAEYDNRSHHRYTMEAEYVQKAKWIVVGDDILTKD